MAAQRSVSAPPGWLLLGLALMASCAQTLATSGRVSVTAESVCALRAAAAKHPDPKVRNPDYLAERFVDETFWRASPYRNDPDRARHNPNYFWVNARTHHMDALLVEALTQGATQVVNLGAGFDSRAYRFRERFPQARFFELDLPATIGAKRERVVKIFGAVPDRVVLVATDFNTRPLDEVLRAAAYVASVGEPFLTGWSRSQATAVAIREGLMVVSDLGPAELTARYLTGSDGQPDGMMGEFQRIIHVRVP